MAEKLKKRLRSQAGETIAEVLVALLISVVGLVLLASMIISSTGLVAKTKAAYDRFVEAENVLAAKPESVPEDMEDVVAAETTTVASSMKLVDNTNIFTVTSYSASLGGKTVTSYR